MIDMLVDCKIVHGYKLFRGDQRRVHVVARTFWKRLIL